MYLYLLFSHITFPTPVSAQNPDHSKYSYRKDQYTSWTNPFLQTTLMQDSNKVFAAIEAGGTKFVVAIGNHNKVTRKATFPTRDPKKTWGEVLDFLTQAYSDTPFSAISLASFGPLELNRNSSTYGQIGSTPKIEWQGTDMLAPLRQFNVPLCLETDVNASALGEATLGNGANHNMVAYVTVGTGIGVGIVMEGRILGGNAHLEIGHIPIPHDPVQDPFPGTCPFHKNCLEGLASGTALYARWGRQLSELGLDHPAYELEAKYLGHLCSFLVLGYAPDKIILGGGVMESDYLLDKTRQYCANYLNNYPKTLDVEKLIDPPAYRGDSALLGGFVLANQPVIE
jgi:fructokinase